MDQPLIEQEIKKLLEQLNSPNGHERILAAESIQTRKITDEKIVEALQKIASHDPLRVVRDTARSTLVHLGIIPPIGEELPPAKEQPEPSIEEKRKNFLVGFFGWWVINGLIYFLFELGGVPAFSLAPFLCFVNIIVPIIFASGQKKNRNLAGGILAAIGLNFVITLFMGMFFNGICFVPFFNGS